MSLNWNALNKENDNIESSNETQKSTSKLDWSKIKAKTKNTADNLVKDNIKSANDEKPTVSNNILPQAKLNTSSNVLPQATQDINNSAFNSIISKANSNVNITQGNIQRKLTSGNSVAKDIQNKVNQDIMERSINGETPIQTLMREQAEREELARIEDAKYPHKKIQNAISLENSLNRKVNSVQEENTKTKYIPVISEIANLNAATLPSLEEEIKYIEEKTKNMTSEELDAEFKRLKNNDLLSKKVAGTVTLGLTDVYEEQKKRNMQGTQVYDDFLKELQNKKDEYIQKLGRTNYAKLYEKIYNNSSQQPTDYDFFKQLRLNIGSGITSGVTNIATAGSMMINNELGEKVNDATEWSRNLNESILRGNENHGEIGKNVLNASNVVGNMVPTMGATAVNPALGNVALFANSAGGAYSDAIDNGATLEQAKWNGILSGATELAIEKISGGVSNQLLGTQAVINPSKFTSKINNKVIRGTIDVIADVTGEGLEEVASTAVQPIIDRITYNPNAAYATPEEMWNSFTGSILPTLMLGGIGSVTTGIDNYSDNVIKEIKNSNLSQTQKESLIENVIEGKENLTKVIQENANTITKISEMNNTQENSQQETPITQNQIQSNEVIPQSMQNQNAEQYSLNNATPLRQSINQLQNKGISIQNTTIDTLESIQNKRPGLTITFDENVQGNGVSIVNEDGTRNIKINPNSNRAIEFTLVHELGHDLKTGDADSYNDLQKYVLDFAKTKEGYEIAKVALGETYAKQLGDGNFNLNNEATNDILGEAIGSQEFLNSLAQKKPNVFQRIYNWFKNVLFDGNNTGKTFKERRFLNSIQSKFKTAYEMAFNNQNNNLNNQYSIQEREDGSKYIKIDTDQNVFDGFDTKDYTKIARMYMQDYLKGNTKLGNNDTVDVGSNGIKKYTNPQQQTQYINEKMRLTPELKNILQIAQKVGEGTATKPNSKFSNWEYYKIEFEINGIPFEGIVNIGINKNGGKEFYEINKIRITSNSSFSTSKSSNTNPINDSIPSENNVVNDYYMQNSENNAQDNMDHSLSFNNSEQSEDSVRSVVEDLIRNNEDIASDDLMNKIDEIVFEEFDGVDLDNEENYDKFQNRLNELYEKAKEELIKNGYERAKNYDAFIPTEERLSKESTDSIDFDFGKRANNELQQYQLDKIGDEIDNLVNDKETTNNISITNNHSRKSSDANYIDVYNKNTDKAATIRIGNHFVEGVSGNADYYINISDFKTINELIEEVNKTIGLAVNKVNNNDISQNSNKSSFSNSNDTWQKFLDDNFNLMPNATRTYLNTNNNIKSNQKAEVNETGATVTTKKYEARKINSFISDVTTKLETTKYGNMKELKNITKSIVNEARNGTLTEAKINQYANVIFDSTVRIDSQFYDENKNIRDDIRNTRLYVSEDIRRGIADFDDFKKSNFGVLSLSSNNSDLSVDRFYQQLSMSRPDLFPEDIVNGIDQLERISDVAKSIRKSEVKVSEYVNSNYGRDAREDFVSSVKNSIGTLINDVEQVKAVENENLNKIQSKNKTADLGKNIDAQQIMKLYDDNKRLKKEYEKALRKELLTNRDKVQLDRLVKGEISLDDIAGEKNKEVINRLYQLKKPLEDTNNQIKEAKAAKKAARFEIAEKVVENSANWKDKKFLGGLRYGTETAERNIYDMVKNTAEAKRINDIYFKPIHEHEAQSTRKKNEIIDKVKDLKISTKEKYNITETIKNKIQEQLPEGEVYKGTKLSESSLVQLLGEKIINEADIKELGVDANKIRNATDVFRNIYNEIYTSANNVLVENGYAPVDYRKDYFPHFSESKPDSIFKKIADKLGIETSNQELPTDLAGLTHTFKPGKKWVANFLARKGNITEYNALKGLDTYLQSTMDVIYHTDDIQNLRTLEDAVRYKYSSKGIQEKIDETRDRLDLDDIQKNAILNDLYNTDTTDFSHFVTWLREYTDNLSGKKSIEDRNMEHNLGRAAYKTMKNVEGRVASNMIGGNINSALTNFIPLAQGWGEVSSGSMLKSLWDTARNASKTDNFINESNFLTNRRGSDSLYKTSTQKLSEKAGALMNVIDEFTSETLVRAKYYDNIKNRMTQEDAMANADEFGASVMGDRSKGATPTSFNASNPIAKTFTMFQLEVNNQYRYWFKDLPRNVKDEVGNSIVKALFKIFAASWLYGTLKEKLTGSRSVTDPINIVAETCKDVVDEKTSIGTTITNLSERVIDELPFISTLTGGGRIPISSAFPDATTTINAIAGISTGEMPSNKAWSNLGKELVKPAYYLLLPTAGGQVKKAVEGLSTINNGGEYSIDSNGDKKLKYAIDTKNMTPLEKAVMYGKATIFGKSSLKEAQEYYNSGGKQLSVRKTQGYEGAKELDIPAKVYLDINKEVNEIQPENGEKYGKGEKANKIIAIIEKYDLNKKQRAYLYQVFAKNTEIDKINVDSMEEAG